MGKQDKHSSYKIKNKTVSGYRASNMFAITTVKSKDKIWLPNPDKDGGLSNTIATMVNSARNTKAIVTAQKIGRDQQKFALSWSFLSKSEWEQLLKFWDDHFIFKLYYYDPVKNRITNHKFYISDRTYEYFDIDSSGQPIAYINCKASIVDTGD